jgi:formylglycine-generating enzyme required for sulfatase activity
MEPETTRCSPDGTLLVSTIGMAVLMLVAFGFSPYVHAETGNPERFVHVKAGTTTAENGGVALPYDVLVGKFEVTFEEYDAFCEATRRRIPDDKQNWGRGNMPVTSVTWSDSVEYANWLSQHQGLEPAYGQNEDTPGGYSLRDLPERLAGYRLLTSYEWEYAARGGEGGRGSLFSGSDVLKEVGWFLENSEGKAHPVGRLAPNELGLYDMSGNVREWVNPRNEFLATATATGYRGYRGGSWYQSDKGCRLGFTPCNDPKTKNSTTGFRLARTWNVQVIAVPEKTPSTRKNVGDSKNTVVALALATRSESPERADIAKEALSMLKPQGTIDMTKECSLFDFINDPGPAAFKEGAMPADKYLILESLRGDITPKELEGVKKHYLEYSTPTTNYVNYHFRRWYVPFMGEWIYERVGAEDKRAVLNKMIDMGRSVLAHRNDRFGKFITQFGDISPAWPHFRWARVTSDYSFEQPVGISDFGYRSWASVPAKIIVSDPTLWNDWYQGKTYRAIADEFIADSLVTLDYCLDKFLNQDQMLYMPSRNVQPLEKPDFIPGWNRAFKMMVSTLPLIAALEKDGIHPEQRERMDRANASMIEEFWKYGRTRMVHGRKVYDYPARLDVGYQSTDFGHASFDSECLQAFHRSGRYPFQAEQFQTYANALADVLCLGNGKFRLRFDGTIQEDFRPALHGITGLIWYAEYRPELFELIVEHTWNDYCKRGATPDSAVVWEILKLKERVK